MKACDVIRTVMTLRNVKVIDLAEALKIKQPALSQRLKQDNLSTDKMVEMLDAMGYKLVAVPIGKKLKQSDCCYEITKEA